MPTPHGAAPPHADAPSPYRRRPVLTSSPTSDPGQRRPSPHARRRASPDPVAGTTPLASPSSTCPRPPPRQPASQPRVVPIDHPTPAAPVPTNPGEAPGLSLLCSPSHQRPCTRSPRTRLARAPPAHCDLRPHPRPRPELAPLWPRPARRALTHARPSPTSLCRCAARPQLGRAHIAPLYSFLVARARRLCPTPTRLLCPPSTVARRAASPPPLALGSAPVRRPRPPLPSRRRLPPATARLSSATAPLGVRPIWPCPKPSPDPHRPQGPMTAGPRPPVTMTGGPSPRTF
nr:vegetative cell wall protein gp1-like [Aegilops tauschii subsp. strangulata]